MVFFANTDENKSYIWVHDIPAHYSDFSLIPFTEWRNTCFPRHQLQKNHSLRQRSQDCQIFCLTGRWRVLGSVCTLTFYPDILNLHFIPLLLLKRVINDQFRNRSSGNWIILVSRNKLISFQCSQRCEQNGKHLLLFS